MVDSGIMVMLVSPPLAPPSDCLVAAKTNGRLLMFSVPVWRCARCFLISWLLRVSVPIWSPHIGDSA